MPVDSPSLSVMAQKLRRECLLATSEAGSGHPTSCLSCAEILAVLFFDEMRFDPRDPSGNDADVFVLSKGHAAPALWAALHEAGAIADDPRTLRQFDSPLEGHPTPRVPWVRVATGSLGQGLSAAVGMALARKLDRTPARVYVLLGDGEAAEGAVWEAAAFASHNALDNLCAIVDFNRLGQSGPSMFERDAGRLEMRLRAFGVETFVVDGHDLRALREAFKRARACAGRPSAILARTTKGKGVSFLEDKDDWHGRPLRKGEELDAALRELGPCDVTLSVEPRRYTAVTWKGRPRLSVTPSYELDQRVATREAYGSAVATLARQCRDVVAIDGDTKNSTFAETVKRAVPEQFVEAFIAEQNMVGVALGLATEGKIPFVSTFACFLTRAHDFIRMAAYSRPEHLVLCGSHAGVSIGEDGPSQMGLEDLAMFRAIADTAVLYPCDAISAERVVETAARTRGVVYVRTSRPKTKVIYGATESFPLGGSKTLRTSAGDVATVVAAGITVYEALEAHEILASQGIVVRVIDLYSVKPLDAAALLTAARETKRLVTVEDHSVCGGIGEAVASVVAGEARVDILGVREAPRSGRPSELLTAHGISAAAIADAVKRSL